MKRRLLDPPVQDAAVMGGLLLRDQAIGIEPKRQVLLIHVQRSLDLEPAATAIRVFSEH